MEEKQLEQNDEVMETSVEQTKDEVIELLEPTPYQNKYKKELDKEDSETATIPTDTSSEEEATPNEERPVNAEDKVFKKRYDDLKRHYDSTISKHKDEVVQLKSQLENKEIIPPKSAQELETWKIKYPDVYDIMKSVAMTESKEQAKTVQNKLQSLEQAQSDLSKEKAELELLKVHPDFKDIRKTDDFHEWAKNQDQTIQSWLYDNTSNHMLCARAIDLYKMDKGFTANKKSNKDVKTEAAKAVTTTKRDTGKDATAKKIWSVDEITKLKPVQYLKYEKDIDLARREGRIRN
jgi:hypothetical protein|tara:strand:+ start:71 stop:946 length:876 start_codon:yes stop_codon:yes gene_type:complete